MTAAEHFGVWADYWKRCAATALADHNIDRYGWACHQRDIAVLSARTVTP